PHGAVRQLGPFGRRGFGLVAEDREEPGSAALIVILGAGLRHPPASARSRAARLADTAYARAALPVEFGDRAARIARVALDATHGMREHEVGRPAAFRCPTADAGQRGGVRTPAPGVAGLLGRLTDARAGLSGRLDAARPDVERAGAVLQHVRHRRVEPGRLAGQHDRLVRGLQRGVPALPAAGFIAGGDGDAVVATEGAVQVVTLPLWGVARANDLPRAPRLTGAPLAAVQLRHQRADLGVVEAERVAEPVPLLRRRNRRRLTGGGGPMAGHAVEP